MYLVKTPRLIQHLFPNLKWSVPTTEQKVHLTFDDGPVPEVTSWVLDQLKAFDAKATFFCVGENVEKNPDIFERIIEEGHAVGNHTFNHLNGWSSDNIKYFHNIRKCARLVNSKLFRPPYGRIKSKQTQFLQRHYDIVMWSLLSGDFDPKLSKEMCLENVVSNLSPGSIVVFHDSVKAFDKLQYVLPKTLEYMKLMNYQSETIKESPDSKSIKLTA